MPTGMESPVFCHPLWNHKMRRLLFLVMCVVFCLSTLPGCGKNESEEKKEDPRRGRAPVQTPLK